ncbi:MAG: cobalamin biosynthesis protein, partial [Anaerovoracaceae bacterium]
VTTATDINGKIAIDEWAMKQGLFLESLPMAKEISAGILAGEPVGFFSDFPVRGSLPPELSGGNEATLGVVISDKAQKEPRFSRQLNLVPKRYSLGIGCRRGTKKEKIEELVDGVCTAYNIAQEAIAQVATIDLKKDEEGLLAFCRERKLKLITYTGEALAKLEGEFTPSAFVQSVTGVDNVCERAAIMDGGTLWIKKTAKDGVTLAVAKKEYDSSF